ncbi:MAG TPA: hypothetical protein V6C69_12945 [Trichormus sp.]|jgi:hypothetical protein
MNCEPLSENTEPTKDKCCIEVLLVQIKEFDPNKTAGSWAPNEGGEIIVELNKLHDCLVKKAAEIKQYVRTLTVEELNDLDGFARCGTAAPPAATNSDAPTTR